MLQGRNFSALFNVLMFLDVFLAIPLTGLFIALQLTGTVNWSWVWVLSPLWMGVILILVISLLDPPFEDM